MCEQFEKEVEPYLIKENNFDYYLNVSSVICGLVIRSVLWRQLVETQFLYCALIFKMATTDKLSNAILSDVLCFLTSVRNTLTNN